jgi:hypothetical protein
LGTSFSAFFSVNSAFFSVISAFFSVISAVFSVISGIFISCSFEDTRETKAISGQRVVCSNNVLSLETKETEESDDRGESEKERGGLQHNPPLLFPPKPH